MKTDRRPVIRMHAFDPSILTAEEFEQVVREVRERVLMTTLRVDGPQVSDRILMRMLYENASRYSEVKMIEQKEIPSEIASFLDQISDYFRSRDAASRQNG